MNSFFNFLHFEILINWQDSHSWSWAVLVGGQSCLLGNLSLSNLCFANTKASTKWFTYKASTTKASTRPNGKTICQLTVIEFKFFSKKECRVWDSNCRPPVLTMDTLNHLPIVVPLLSSSLSAAQLYLYFFFTLYLSASL